MQGTKSEGDYSFLESGSLLHSFLTKIGLSDTGLRLRVLLFISVTYVPLLLLALLQGVAYGQHLKVPFFYDVSEASRFLLVGPLLIFAEVLIEPWLMQVVQHVRNRLLLPPQLPNYENLLKRTVRLRDSNLAEILLLVGVFAWQWLDVALLAKAATGTWQVLPTSADPTYAWYWYAWLAKPLVRFLWLRWLWRYVIWSMFLCALARLPLKIMPTHPDRHGGLAFIATGHTKFSILAFIFGAQAASIFGENILVEGKTLMDFRYEIVGVIVIILVVFLTPLLSFTTKLLEAKRTGIFEYGALANAYTEQFHEKWIGHAGNEQLLGTSDIQSLADIGNSYEVVHEMKVCLINKENIMTFAVVTLIPFAPLLFTIYPFDELLNHLLKVVL